MFFLCLPCSGFMSHSIPFPLLPPVFPPFPCCSFSPSLFLSATPTFPFVTPPLSVSLSVILSLSLPPYLSLFLLPLLLLPLLFCGDGDKIEALLPSKVP